LDYISEAIKFEDLGNSGSISFSGLQKIMEGVNIQMKDSYIDFLIYLMKSSKNPDLKIEDLEYAVR
jgi:hypothetical protein